MQKKIFSFIFFLFLAINLSSCNSSPEKTPKKRLKIGVLPAEISYPFFLGKKEGIFKKHGWQVELLSFQSAQELTQAFQSQELDAILGDLVSTSLLYAAKIDVQAIALLRGGSPNEGRIAILAAPGSNYKSLSDLPGHGVALSLNTHAEYVLDKLLQEENISPHSVNKVKIPKIPVRLSLLSTNRIPAAVLPEPYASLAEKQGARLLADDSSLNFSQIVLTIHKKIVERENGELQEFLAAYNESVTAINKNPEKYHRDFLNTANIPEDLHKSYKLRKFSLAKPVPNEKLAATWEWLKKKKLLSTPIEYTSLTTDAFLPSPPMY